MKAKLIRNSFIIFFSGCLLLPILFLTSCGIFSSQKTVYVDTTSYQNFIRERSMSLKFNSKTLSNGKFEEMFGTTWIMGVDKNNANKYYLATNIHVIAPAVIDISNSILSEPSILSTYKINTNYIDSIALGFPKDPKKIYDENDLDLEIFDNKIKVFPSVEFIRTGFNTHSYKNAIIPYSMIDLAVLSFDFSNTSNKFKNYLKYYMNNQTKFSLSELSYIDQNNYFIGGYPAMNLNVKKTQIGKWNFKDSQNEGIKGKNGLIINPAFSTNGVPIPNHSYLKTTNPTTYYDVYGSSIGTIFPNNINYAKTIGQDSINYSFQNIANQISITNLNLEGGSSGSMAINQNSEVCGIYWGVYNSIIKTNEKIIDQKLGTFDIFVSGEYPYGPTTTPYGNYQKYNVLSEIKKQIPTISGGNWSQVK